MIGTPCAKRTKRVDVEDNGDMLVVHSLDYFYMENHVPLKCISAVCLRAIRRLFAQRDSDQPRCKTFRVDQSELSDAIKISLGPLVSHIEKLVHTNPAMYISTYGIMQRPPGCPLRENVNPVHEFCLCVPVSRHSIPHTLVSPIISSTPNHRLVAAPTKTKPLPWVSGEICVIGGKRSHVGASNATNKSVFIVYFYCACRDVF